MNRINRGLTIVALAACVVAIAAHSVQAQAPNAPCKAAVCVLLIDWGGGKTAGDYPPDRRYGSGDDFVNRLKTALGARGFIFRDTPIQGAIAMTARPTMKSRVMCDAMAGLNPDKSCTAVTDLAVSFLSGDLAVKAPGAIRISNRCAAGDIYMINTVFAQFAADIIWYQLEGQAAKAGRPVSNC